MAYLGFRNKGRELSDSLDFVHKFNAIPAIAYYDIFKNYYANKQEENFYMIGGSPVLQISINGENIQDNENIPCTLGEITSASTITISPNTIEKKEIRFRVKTSANAREQVLTVDDLGTWDATGDNIKITTEKATNTWYITAVYSTKRTSLEKYPLENLDIIRDKILLTPGDTVFDISNTTMSVEPLTRFAKRAAQGVLNTSNTQYGLCLKTYNSDIYQNWINTEWIEGANGINEASAVDVTSGTQIGRAHV